MPHLYETAIATRSITSHPAPIRRQSQQSEIAKSLMMSRAEIGLQRWTPEEHSSVANLRHDLNKTLSNEAASNISTSPPETTKPDVKPEVKPEIKPDLKPEVKPETRPEMRPPPQAHRQTAMSIAMNDTPATTAPNSPRM